MLVQNISAVLNLVSIELATETEMSEALGIFTCNDLGVSLGVIDVLACRECHAPRCDDRQQWMLTADFGPCSITHLLIIELPMLAICVARRQVECKLLKYTKTPDIVWPPWTLAAVSTFH